MLLTKLSDAVLLSETHRLVREEGRITLEVLSHLREVDRRRLWAERGFSSLTDFAIRELSSSGGAAHRRIEAMRLLQEIPEVASRIETGEMSLSTVSQVQGFFKTEKKEQGREYSRSDKLELLQQVAGLSTREAERVFAARSPEHRVASMRDRERVVTETEVEIKFVADAELQALISEAKDLLAHAADPIPSFNSIFKKSMQTYVEILRKKKNRAEVETTESPAPGTGDEVQSRPESRYVAAATQRFLSRRSGGQCEFVSSDGRRCECRRGLQIEHVIPFSLGGSNELSNLKHYCLAHNQLAAIRVFGVAKMEAFVPGLAPTEAR